MRRLSALWLSVMLACVLFGPAVALAAAPSNDRFAQATKITSFPFTETVDLAAATYQATGEAAEKTPPSGALCSGGSWTPSTSVWYRIVPDVSGYLDVSARAAASSAFPDPRIADFLVSTEDTLSGLSGGICAAPGTDGHFPLQFGRSYYIQVTDGGSGTGNVDVTISFDRRPANDDLAGAKAYPYRLPPASPSFWQKDAVDVRLASSEPGEPFPAGGTRSVWYAFSPVTSGRLTIDTAGSTVAGVGLTVFRVGGVGFDGLVAPSWTTTGAISFDFAAYQSYRIQATDVGTGGNILQVNFNVGTADTTPPTISPHDSITAPATSSAGAVVDYTPPSATDDVDGTVAVSCWPRSGSQFPVGITWVSCTASDSAGNPASPVSFYIRVVGPEAVAPIVPIVSYDVTDAPGSGFRYWYHSYSGATTDTARRIAFGPSDSPVVNETGGGGTLNDGWSAGTESSMLLTTAIDSTGHRLSPAIVLHLDGTYRVSKVTVYGGNPFSSYDGYWAGLLSSVVVEIGGESRRISTAPANGSGYRYDVIDLSDTVLAGIPTDTIVLRGFEATLWGSEVGTFGVSEITVDGTGDRVVPVISDTPADMTRFTPSAAGTVITYAPPTADDAVDGSVPVACLPASGGVFEVGTTHVTCTAVDASGNTATSGFDVVVVLDLPPAISITGVDGSYLVDGQVRITATAVDDRDGVVTPTCSLAPGTTPDAGTPVPCAYTTDAWLLGGLGEYTFTAAATDAAGNRGSASVSFTVSATYPSVANLTKAWTRKASVAKDLMLILDSAAAAEKRGQATAEANKLADFRAAVRAQSGKAIDSDKATLLIAFSLGL